MHDTTTSAKEENSKQSSGEEKTELKPSIEDKIWMIRDCIEYHREYKICKKLKSQFHNFYRDNYDVNCKDWKSDYDNCLIFKQVATDDSARPIIEHELHRMRKRLMAARNNDVWEYRQSPPDFWAAPINKVATDFQIDRTNVTYNSRPCTIL